MTSLEETLRWSIDEVRARFPDFDFVGPAGVLHVETAPTLVDRIRVDLRSPGILRLQSLGPTTVDGISPSDLAGRCTVTASSWLEGAAGRLRAVAPARPRAPAPA